MCYRLRDVKQAAVAAVLEGRKHPKYYHSYNAAKSSKEDWFYDLDEFIEITGGAEVWWWEWVCGGSRGWGCFLWGTRVLERLWSALEYGTQVCTAVGCVGGLTPWSFLNPCFSSDMYPLRSLSTRISCMWINTVHMVIYLIIPCESWEKNPLERSRYWLNSKWYLSPWQQLYGMLWEML